MPGQPRILTKRAAEQHEAGDHDEAGYGRVSGPAVIPGPDRTGRTGQPRDRDPDEDRDRADVVQPALWSWRGPSPGSATCALPGGTPDREATHGIGDEDAGSDQPEACSRHERRDGPGRGGLAAANAARGSAVKGARKHEVGALRPAMGAPRQHADRVPPPVVAGPGVPDRREGANEERPGQGATDELNRMLASGGPGRRHLASLRVPRGTAAARRGPFPNGLGSPASCGPSPPTVRSGLSRANQSSGAFDEPGGDQDGHHGDGRVPGRAPTDTRAVPATAALRSEAKRDL